MVFWKRQHAPTATAEKTPPLVPASPPSATATAAARAVARPRGGQRVLVRPHLTEKSSVLAEQGRYTFLVTPHAEKVSVARAVAERYGVHPVRIAIVRLPGKSVRYGKAIGRRSPVRKAIITLRTGEKIPFGVKT